MADEQDEIVNFGSNYGKKTDSYPEVILRAIENCRIELSKEMTKGGEVETIHHGNPITITIPDQRKKAIQTVKVLKNLMYYEFDEIMFKKFKKAIELINESKKVFFKKYLVMENDMKLKRVAEASGMIMKSKMGNYINDEIENYKLEVYQDIIFQELLLLFKRKNEFSKTNIVNAYD
jgi:hypothetical protein|tara:strand:+ start:10183 stop:10713 length:531 start_codon:yes stop_codon:yes gene_type:complete